MIDIPADSLPLPAAGGLLIGLLYFGALWWTVRRMSSARRPALLVAGSFLVRAAVAAVGIVCVSGGEPLALGVAMAGFLVGRSILIRVVGKPLRVEDVGAGTAPGSGAGLPHRVTGRRE